MPLVKSRSLGSSTPEASSPYDTGFARKLQSREKQIVRLGDDILKARHDAQLLRRHQGQDFRDHLAKAKAMSWRESMELQRGPDAKLRPCDREMYVRVVSLMDRDLWAMDQLRAWFNKKQCGSDAPIPGYLEKSGYLIKNTDPKVEPPPNLYMRVSTTNKNKEGKNAQDFRHPSVYTIPQQAAGARHVCTRKPGPHWMQYDYLAQEQKQEALEKVQRGLHYPAITEPGHVPGCRRAPWRDRPIDEENANRGLETSAKIMEREEWLMKGGGLEQYYQTRELLAERKKSLQKASWAT